jgi:hypothetical protein
MKEEGLWAVLSFFVLLIVEPVALIGFGVLKPGHAADPIVIGFGIWLCMVLFVEWRSKGFLW